MLAFVAAVLVFSLTRFWRLGEYPIYFFTDEAYLPVLAEQLLGSGLRGEKGFLLPVYFPVSMFTAPLLPVYFHLLPVALLGKSVEVARGTTALFAVLGAVALSLALRDPFRSRWWWTAPLFLATTPGWFHLLADGLRDGGDGLRLRRLPVLLSALPAALAVVPVPGHPRRRSGLLLVLQRPGHRRRGRAGPAPDRPPLPPAPLAPPAGRDPPGGPGGGALPALPCG